MRSLLRVGATFLVMGLSGAATRALADQAQCDAIADSLRLMAEQPIVRQIDTRADFPGQIEMIFTESATYISAGGRPRKTGLTRAHRLAQLNQALEAQPLRDCTKESSERIDGIDTVMFRYRQAPATASADTDELRIWIGAEDRRPRRWQAGQTVSSMRYDGVTPPAD